MMRVTLDELLQVWDVLGRLQRDCNGCLCDERGAFLAFQTRKHLERIIEAWERIQAEGNTVN